MSAPEAAAWAVALPGLLGAAAYLLWGVPRLPQRAAWAATSALLAVGASALVWLPRPEWAIVPMVALLFGHAGWQWHARQSDQKTASPPERAGLVHPATVPSDPDLPATPAPTPPARTLPATLGRYRIDAEIGRGSMGAVYLGHDPQIGRQVAVKTLALSREFEGSKLTEARQRFFREAETAGRLQHPDIVTIFDAGEAQDLAYIAMEYIKGHDLQRHATAARLLPVPQVLEVVARIADALAFAHQQGVVHRDIKPANVMVDLETGLVKVTDFGVARISDASRTRTGLVLGTPSFMSPEQMAGWRTDGRTDLYSLGVMLFQLLSGELPHQGESMAKLMHQIANETAPDLRTLRPELPQALADVVALALEKRPEMRYADGRQFATDLRAVAAAFWAAPAAGAAASTGATRDGETSEFEKTVTFSRTEPRHNSGP